MTAPAVLHPHDNTKCQLGAAWQMLELLVAAGQTVEVRALGVVTPSYRKPHTESGFFTDLGLAARAGARLSPQASGVYVTLNPVNPALLARSANRTHVTQAGMATADGDVVRRHWLVIDVDATRPSGIAATEDEKAHAQATSERILAHLTGCGWPEPALIDSGNGSYLLYRIDLPVDDGGLVRRCLQALSGRFDTPDAHVDTSMFNPARIVRLAGTINRKGDDLPERPHRPARLLHVPAANGVVPAALLEALAGAAPARPERPPISGAAEGAGFDVDAFIARHVLAVEPSQPWESGRKWVFPVCPFNPAHDNRSAVLIQHASGAVSFRCHHNGCADRGWRDLRAHFEPTEPPAGGGVESAAGWGNWRKWPEAQQAACFRDWANILLSRDLSDPEHPDAAGDPGQKIALMLTHLLAGPPRNDGPSEERKLPVAYMATCAGMSRHTLVSKLQSLDTAGLIRRGAPEKVLTNDGRYKTVVGLQTLRALGFNEKLPEPERKADERERAAKRRLCPSCGSDDVLVKPIAAEEITCTACGAVHIERPPKPPKFQRDSPSYRERERRRDYDVAVAAEDAEDETAARDDWSNCTVTTAPTSLQEPVPEAEGDYWSNCTVADVCAEATGDAEGDWSNLTPSKDVRSSGQISPVARPPQWHWHANLAHTYPWHRAEAPP